MKFSFLIDFKKFDIRVNMLICGCYIFWIENIIYAVAMNTLLIFCYLQDVNEMDTAKEDVLKTSCVNVGEQEECRMSNFSNIGSNITSSMNIRVRLLWEHDFDLIC